MSLKSFSWTNFTVQQVAETTTLDTIHCLCSHLTSFGGQLFVAPNPVDFDKVFTEFDRLPETGNVAVIIAVSCVFGLYLLLLVWARKADMQDALKVGIVSFTGMNVFVSFTGMNASSSEYKRDIHFYKRIHSWLFLLFPEEVAIPNKLVCLSFFTFRSEISHL